MGVGEYAKKNMDYLLLRAEQELDVYFKQTNLAETILNTNGLEKIVYTFLLKGKEKPNIQTYLKVLCRKGHVMCKDL